MTELTLYLLRHGESEANVDRVFASFKVNPALSDAGVQQATMQAKSLEEIEFSAMYVSPLLRTRQTAGIVGKQRGLESILSEYIHEVNVGDLDGKDQNDPNNWETFTGVIRKWGQGFSDFGFPNGETLNDVGKRFSKFLDELKGKHQKPVLVVGHCVLFMAVFWLFCENHAPEFEAGRMEYGHLSVISGNSDGFRILKFNIPPDGTRLTA